MQKTFILFLLLLLNITIFPTASHAFSVTPIQTQKRVAQQVATYKAINGKSYSLHNISPSAMCAFINEALTLNEDVEFHYVKEYPRSHVYVILIEWDKLFFKESYIIVTRSGYVAHKRMDKSLQKDIDEWQALEDMSDDEYEALQEKRRQEFDKMWEDLRKRRNQSKN